jgi:hypothetical protein
VVAIGRLRRLQHVLLCADTQDFSAMWRNAGIELLWHPSLSLESGDQVLDILEDCLGRTQLDALCIEGLLLRGPHGTGRFHMLAGTDAPMIDWVRNSRRWPNTRGYRHLRGLRRHHRRGQQPDRRLRPAI